ncbi:hypothetical protein BC628DRAFT_1357168, partial [Trametes gibbosa]
MASKNTITCPLSRGMRTNIHSLAGHFCRSKHGFARLEHIHHRRNHTGLPEPRTPRTQCPCLRDTRVKPLEPEM